MKRRCAAVMLARGSLLPFVLPFALPVVLPLAAQPAPRRLGVLAPFAQPTLAELLQVLQDGLRAQGLERAATC